MKKILFLFIIAVYVFTITSCSDDESKKEVNTVDSTKTDTTMHPALVCATGDSSEIKYWQIDSLTAVAMETNNGASGKPSKIKFSRDHIDKKIKDSFLQGYVGWIAARYRSEDVERYRTKRCMPLADSAGMVAQYFTKIIVVKQKIKGPTASQLAAAYNYYYFDIATICPPPDGACNVQKQDSTKKK